ncbi:flagellar biosynthesis protein FlhF [Gammaproteobacteria bacterium 53_120_T64]|nr:flagellar biosynthesis protein FlhF [Gammaproteobacteria bacterium 53_120_T64]
MKIKRFTADTMREAIRSVRDTWGPDAVILSNKKLGNGVEITAAIDFEIEEVEQLASETAHTPSDSVALSPAPRPDTAAQRQVPTPEQAPPSLQSHLLKARASSAHRATTGSDEISDLRREISDLRGLIEGELTQMSWREIGRHKPHKAALMRRLASLGLKRELCTTLATQGTVPDDAEAAWKQALLDLAGMLTEGDHDLLAQGGTYAIIGSTGVGKTTTVAKLAAQYALRHGADKIGLITTDCFRIGGVDQLSTFGELLDIPVFLATDRLELSDILDQLSSKELVLIDTAGMSQRDIELSKQLATLVGAGHDIQFYLTLSATAQQAITAEIMSVFSDIKLAGTVVTKVDEAASLGGVLNALIKHQLPTFFISNGQKVPEDLHPGSAIELVKIARDLLQRSSPHQPILETESPRPTTHSEGKRLHG